MFLFKFINKYKEMKRMREKRNIVSLTGLNTLTSSLVIRLQSKMLFLNALNCLETMNMMSPQELKVLVPGPIE